MTSHTAPFDPSVEALITGVHTQSVSAVAHIAGMDPVALDVVGGRIGWSERRSPRVTADLEVSRPADPDVIAGLDARARPRVEVTVAYVLPNGDLDAHVVADLHLRRRSVIRPAGTLRLSLASDEALVIDSGPTVNTTIGGDGTEAQYLTKTNGPAWIAEIILEGLWNTDYPTGPEIIVTAPEETATWPAVVRDFWDSIVDVADQLDLDVYDNGDRVFHIDKRPTVASDSVLTVKGGAGGILLDSDSSVSRDEWANYVAIRYDWQDSAGARRWEFGTARVVDGPFAVGTVGYKNYVADRDVAVSKTGANNAARAILNRMLSRSRGLSLTTVPAWWVRPGRTVTYQPEAGDQQRHIVSEVDFDLEQATMRLVTRLPDTDSTLGE